jgi:hypothetical protein
LGHQITKSRLCIAPNVAVVGQSGIFVDNEIGGIGQCQAITEVEKCHCSWLSPINMFLSKIAYNKICFVYGYCFISYNQGMIKSFKSFRNYVFTFPLTPRAQHVNTPSTKMSYLVCLRSHTVKCTLTKP